MQGIDDRFEPYHMHLGYTLTLTMLAWLVVLWYSRRRLRDHPGQRALLYGLAIGLPLFAEIGSYAITLLRPRLDLLTGHAIVHIHQAVLRWMPLDETIDLFLTPALNLAIAAVLILLAAGSLARWYYGTLRLYRILGSARLLRETTKAALEARFHGLAGAAAPALPAVLLVDLPMPLACTVGVLRPRIYLSSRLLDVLAPDEVVAVLCHEWAHIVRRDLLWNGLIRLFRDMLCFLPGVYRFWRSMIGSQDEACDTLAAQLTRQPLALARALVKVAQAWHTCPRTPLPMVSLFALPGASPRARVERMVRLSEAEISPPAPGAYVLAGALLLLGVLPVLLGC